MEELLAALLEIQTKLKAPKNLRNTFAGFDYRNAEGILEAVKPLLKEYEITQVISDEVVCIGSANYVKSTVTIYKNGAELPVSGYAREEETLKGQIAAQITGGASSYAKKYALNNLYNIDDSEDIDSVDNTQHETKPLNNATTNQFGNKGTPKLATDKQRNMIKAKLSVLGLTSDEEIASYLQNEHEVEGKLTQSKASEVIDYLINVEGI